MNTNVIKNKEIAQTIETRVASLVNRGRGSWSGTMTELFEAITRKTPSVWPSSASSLSRVVNRMVPTLRRAGYSVTFSIAGRDRKRIVSFAKR